MLKTQRDFNCIRKNFQDKIVLCYSEKIIRLEIVKINSFLAKLPLCLSTTPRRLIGEWS
jgi:hypothetical protein